MNSVPTVTAVLLAAAEALNACNGLSLVTAVTLFSMKFVVPVTAAL